MTSVEESLFEAGALVVQQTVELESDTDTFSSLCQVYWAVQSGRCDQQCFMQ